MIVKNIHIPLGYRHVLGIRIVKNDYIRAYASAGEDLQNTEL